MPAGAHSAVGSAVPAGPAARTTAAAWFGRIPLDSAAEAACAAAGEATGSHRPGGMSAAHNDRLPDTTANRASEPAAARRDRLAGAAEASGEVPRPAELGVAGACWLHDRAGSLKGAPNAAADREVMGATSQPAACRRVLKPETLRPDHQPRIAPPKACRAAAGPNAAALRMDAGPPPAGEARRDEAGAPRPAEAEPGPVPVCCRSVQRPPAAGPPRGCPRWSGRLLHCHAPARRGALVAPALFRLIAMDRQAPLAGFAQRRTRVARWPVASARAYAGAAAERYCAPTHSSSAGL